MDRRLHPEDRRRGLDGQPRLAPEDDGRLGQLLRRGARVARFHGAGTSAAGCRELGRPTRGARGRVGQLLPPWHAAVAAAGRLMDVDGPRWWWRRPQEEEERLS